MKRHAFIKKISAFSLAIVLMMGLASFAGTRTVRAAGDASNNGVKSDNKADLSFPEIPKLKDVLICHYTLITDDRDTFKEYQVVYYGQNTKTLKAIHDETHFFKSSGYTEEHMKQFSIDSMYPGISSLSFVKSFYEDKGDYFCYIVEYNELDDPGHLDQLYDCGAKILLEKGSGKTVNADSYKQILLDGGAKETQDTGLHTTYE